MQTLIEDLELLPEVDLNKTLKITHNGEELTILFESLKFKKMFEVFYRHLGETVEYCQVYEEAGIHVTITRLPADVASINRSISELNLRIVNDEGNGYRLVEGLDHGPIKKFQLRTYTLNDGTEIALKCNQETFDLLDYIASSNGATTKEIQIKFNLKIESHAYRFMSYLAKSLREIGWNISGNKENGVRRYRLVNLSREEI